MRLPKGATSIFLLKLSKVRNMKFAKDHRILFFSLLGSQRKVLAGTTNMRKH